MPNQFNRRNMTYMPGVNDYEYSSGISDQEFYKEYQLYKTKSIAEQKYQKDKKVLQQKRYQQQQQQLNLLRQQKGRRAASHHQKRNSSNQNNQQVNRQENKMNQQLNLKGMLSLLEKKNMARSLVCLAQLYMKEKKKLRIEEHNLKYQHDYGDQFSYYSDSEEDVSQLLDDFDHDRQLEKENLKLQQNYKEIHHQFKQINMQSDLLHDFNKQKSSNCLWMGYTQQDRKCRRCRGERNQVNKSSMLNQLNDEPYTLFVNQEKQNEMQPDISLARKPSTFHDSQIKRTNTEKFNYQQQKKPLNQSGTLQIVEEAHPKKEVSAQPSEASPDKLGDLPELKMGGKSKSVYQPDDQ